MCNRGLIVKSDFLQTTKRKTEEINFEKNAVRCKKY